MDTRTNQERENAALEIRAIVDLVEANVMPDTDTEAWATEIAALRDEAAEESAQDAAIGEVIEISSTLA